MAQYKPDGVVPVSAWLGLLAWFALLVPVAYGCGFAQWYIRVVPLGWMPAVPIVVGMPAGVVWLARHARVRSPRRLGLVAAAMGLLLTYVSAVGYLHKFVDPWAATSPAQVVRGMQRAGEQGQMYRRKHRGDAGQFVGATELFIAWGAQAMVTMAFGAQVYFHTRRWTYHARLGQWTNAHDEAQATSVCFDEELVPKTLALAEAQPQVEAWLAMFGSTTGARSEYQVLVDWHQDDPDTKYLTLQRKAMWGPVKYVKVVDRVLVSTATAHQVLAGLRRLPNPALPKMEA